MKTRDLVAIVMILVGLSSATWQINRLINKSPEPEPIVTLVSNLNKDCDEASILCATENVLCESTRMTFRVVGATLKHADQFVRLISRSI